MTTALHRAAVTLAVVCGLAAPAAAQLPDPFVIPRGALRVSFEPSYTNYDVLFDEGGTQFALGRFFSTDTLGVPFLPTLASAQAAVRALVGDSVYRMNAGALTARQDADIRRFPFDLSLGLTDRLTLTATVPLVTTRVHSTTAIDTSGANVGWNQVTSISGSATGLADVATLLAELDAAIASVQMGLAAGSFGCPSTTCDLAQDLVARGTALASDLAALTGVTAGGEVAGELPPFAPLASSIEGMAIADAINSFSADLQVLGEVPLSGMLPLPTAPVEGGALSGIVTGAEFGYNTRSLDPEEPAKLGRVGDIRIGLRYGIVQHPGLRLVLGAGVQLPTGFRDLADDLIDIGPGDRQLDLEWTVDGAFEPGSRLGVWFAAGYTLQLGDRLTRRIAPVDAPLVPVTAEREVERNLGDILRASIHPHLRLNDQFRVFVSAAYYRKGADAYAVGGQAVPELEALTARETVSFGAGLWYRSETGRRSAALPIEAGLSYRSAFSGSGGATPKTNALNLSIRFFYRIWGGLPAPPPDEEDAQSPPG